MLSPLGVHTISMDGTVILRVIGEIDTATEEVLERYIETALDRTARGLIIDLTEVRFMGSEGINALARAKERTDSRALPLFLCVSEPVRRTLEVAGVGQTFSIVPNQKVALDKLEVAAH